MASASEIRTARYLELLESLRVEFERANGNDHGWVTWAASELGRSQGYISQILKGKPVGDGSIREAAKRRRIDEGWFYESGDQNQTPESHVEPLNEHPYLAKLRKTGDFPPWVLDASQRRFQHRDGKYKYSELYAFCEDIFAAGEPHLKAMEARIGPPKRDGK